MLKILLGTLLSFSALNLSYVCVNENMKLSTQSYDPNTISYDETEITWWFDGVIGVHQMLKINSYDDLGKLTVDRLTSWYDGSKLNNFNFSETVTTCEDTNISLTTSYSLTIAQSLGAKTNINNVSISAEESENQKFSISGTLAYAYSKTITTSVNFSVYEDAVKDKTFALGLVANVYKLNYDTWNYRNYWWGNKVEENSRKSDCAYIVADPVVTIIYKD